MTTAPHAVPLPPPEPWAGEERILREAILMVASHGAPRVLVAGLTSTDRYLDRCRLFALEAGVRVRIRPTARDDRVDVVIEIIH